MEINSYKYWKWDYHHAGFDIVSNRILEIVKEYYGEVEKHFDDDIEDTDDNKTNNAVEHINEPNYDRVCFWVTGHSMGAGVANLVASSLICSDNINIIKGIGGNENNVYCYTFASSNIFYLTDNTYERGAK